MTDTADLETKLTEAERQTATSLCFYDSHNPSDRISSLIRAARQKHGNNRVEVHDAARLADDLEGLLKQVDAARSLSNPKLRKVATVSEATADLEKRLREEEAASCDHCQRSVHADLVIPCWAWIEISPTRDLDGFLCPNCIIERLHAKGIRCEAALMSPIIDSVSAAEMSALRRVENLEMALDGFRNRWGAALDARIREGGKVAPEGE